MTFSRPVSPASNPSTLAESLKSYWESRTSQPRRPTEGNTGGVGGGSGSNQQFLRNIYHRNVSGSSSGIPFPRRTTTFRTSSTTGYRKVFIRTSAKVNQAVNKLVSLILRDFVQEWYSKVTNDHEFAREVKSHIMLVTNELERRCLRVDWVQFILFELPDIIHLHIKDTHQCMARLNTVYVGNENSTEAMFQSMQPHVALAMAADSELSYLRHLSRELLLVLMPPEAQNDEAVHHLLREILACTVLRNVVDAIADPSTLNEGIIRALGRYSKKEYFYAADMSRYETMPVKVEDGEGGNGAEPANNSTSVENMLHEAQNTGIGTVEDIDPLRLPTTAAPTLSNKSIVVNSSETSNHGGVMERLSSQLSFGSRWLIRDLFSPARWRGWQNNMTRGVVYLHLIIVQAFGRIFSVFSEYTFSLNQIWQTDDGMQTNYRGAMDPLLGLINALLLLDRYNHWVWIQFVLYIYPLVNFLAGIAIDRLLVRVVGFLLNEQQLATYVDLLVENLWKPENGGKFKPKDQRPYKTLEQQEMLRRDATELVAEMLPYVATRFFYGMSEHQRMTAAQRILEPFENRQLNKHLVYNVLDAIVGKIASELKET